MNVAMRAIAAALLLCGGVAAAFAQELSLRQPDGKIVTVIDDKGVSGPLLQWIERRNPDGSLDLGFGQNGRALFSLTSADILEPRSLSIDAQGRLVLSGRAIGAADHSVAVVSRFLSDGRADPRWGTQGTSRIASADGKVKAVDSLAMPDQGMLLLGQLTSSASPEAVLWRLRLDGTADTGFGRGGMLHLAALDGAQPTSLRHDEGGTVLIASQRAHAGGLLLEAHRWQQGQERVQLVARQDAPPGWSGPAKLERRNGVWHWFDSGSAGAAGLPMQALDAAIVVERPMNEQTPAADAAETAGASLGGVGFNPFSTGAAPAQPVAEAPVDTFPALPWVTVLLATALAAIAWWWMRRPATIDLGLLDARRRQVDDVVWALRSAAPLERDRAPALAPASAWLDVAPATSTLAPDRESLGTPPAPLSPHGGGEEAAAPTAEALAATASASPLLEEAELAGTSATHGADDSPPVRPTDTVGPGCQNRLAGPDPGIPDDLKRIKGIGPKLESLLHDEGIYNFWQIARWRREDVNFISSRLGSFKGRIERDDWVRQARALAEPDDLKRIRGIGPKLESLLHDEGIYFFWQIAQWSRDDMDFISGRLHSFKDRIERDGWVRQARALAGMEPSTATSSPSG